MPTFKPLNTYVIIELTLDKSPLTNPDEDILKSTKGVVVDPGDFADIQTGDIVNFVWNASHGNIVSIDGGTALGGQDFAHVKHEHLLSVEI